MAVRVQTEQKHTVRRQFSFYLPWNDTQVARMIVQSGHRIVLVEEGDWDIALFTGGPDICPMLYGERMHETTNMHLMRDLREIQFFKGLHHLRMKVGICRGAQLLNVLSGGRLWQHVSGHNDKDGHFVKLYDSEALVKMSSRHHQLMIPGSNAMVIGAAAEATRKYSETMGQTELLVNQLKYEEPEIVYYGDTHSLCFQPHPEDEDDMCRVKFFEYIEALWSDDNHKKALMEWE